MTTTLRVTCIDVCESCYLTDHHNRDGECLIGVAVSGETSVKSVKDILFWEAWRADNIPAFTDNPKEEEAILRKAINACLPSREDSELFDDTLPMEDESRDYDDLVQAWFVFTWDATEDSASE